MRILLINDNLEKTGGAELYFWELYRRLKKTPSIDVSVLGFGKQQTNEKNIISFKKNKSIVHKLYFKFFCHKQLYQKIKTTLDKINPDVIHIHNIKEFPITLLKAVEGYPVLQTVHDFGHLCPTGQNIHQDGLICATGFKFSCWLKHHTKFNFFIYCLLLPGFFRARKFLLKNVYQFIAPSPLLTSYLNQNRFNACYIPPFKNISCGYNYEEIEENHFLFVGSLANHKGIDLLIREFALASKKNKELKLSIVGTGPLDKHLNKAIKKLNLTKQVTCYGFQKDVSCFYKKCMMTIFPSIGLESFGLVMLESMSFGRAVLGINRGTVPWLVNDNENGLLFETKPGDLANKILYLAQHPEKTLALGKNAYLSAQEKFNNKNTLAEIIALYGQIKERAQVYPPLSLSC